MTDTTKAERAAFEAYYGPRWGASYLAWVAEKGRYAWDATQEAWTVWQAAITHAVPPGHQVVPDEPTQQMCQEGQWKAKEWPKFPLRIVPIYKAMLSAAPGHLLVNPTPAPPPPAKGDRFYRERDLTGCAAGKDGECAHSQCPQLRDGEPSATGRHCPLDA